MPRLIKWIMIRTHRVKTTAKMILTKTSQLEHLWKRTMEGATWNQVIKLLSTMKSWLKSLSWEMRMPTTLMVSLTILKLRPKTHQEFNSINLKMTLSLYNWGQLLSNIRNKSKIRKMYFNINKIKIYMWMRIW